VRAGCSPVAAPPDTFRWVARAADTRYMDPVAPVALSSAGGSRTAGWQVQLRVDYVVNMVMQTHRGRSEDAVAQAIQDQLRSVGVVPNGRQVAQYAAVISQLPQLPPRNRTA
jgi:hypothetical protein